MDRQPLYFTILILIIMIGSSFYVSWSVDRGMGEVSVERVTIETSPGYDIELLVYSPRSANHFEPMPVVLTIHGLTGTKEGLYAFNVELARRNFTVVSLDLPGHGDSTQEFDIDDFNKMALDAYVAVRHVQTTFTNVDNESYGVLTHSLGFRVALELEDFPIVPRAYVAVGDVGKVSEDEYVDFPDNLLFAMGTSDEIVTRGDALGAIQEATGNAYAEAGITYGSLDNQTAYRLAFGPSNHAFEVVDSSLVSEAVDWLVQGVQGEAQILLTRDPTYHVFISKNTASILSTVLILVGVIPVMWLTYDLIPEKLRPKRTLVEIEPYSMRKTFEISSVLGACVVICFIAGSLIGLGIENIGAPWLNSMSGAGIVMFLIMTPIILLLMMFLLPGETSKNQMLATVGVKGTNSRELLMDIMRSLVIAATGISWVLVWLGLAGAIETQPAIMLVLLKWPAGIRWSNVILLTILTIPLYLIEAAWIRGLLLTEKEWSTRYRKTVTFLFSLLSKFLLVVLLTVIVIFGTTAAGVGGGRIVLIGVIWIRVLVIDVLAAVFTVWSSFKQDNAWPAVIVSAFILSLVLVTTVPLV